MPTSKKLKQIKPEKIEEVGLYPQSIFEEVKVNKGKARNVLEQAKNQELQKIRDGWHYVTSADGKTSKLTKPNKN